MTVRTSTLVVITLIALTCAPAAVRAADTPPRLPGVDTHEAWPGVEFTQPIGVYHAGDDPEMLYVLEKPGRVLKLAKWRGIGPVPKPAVFLDMRKRVHGASQGGVLGLAFHPQYASNGKLYVTYLQSNKDPREPHNKFKFVVSELIAKNGKADLGTLRPLIVVPKKFPVHQSGRLAFGPDGMLYISTGDGGSKNDADGEAQNPRGLLGKILRIDVDARTSGKAYGIPSNNPWPAIPRRVAPEIWAFGFRNPWGLSWNAQDRMFTTEPGSTGAESREWVTEVLRSGNHGWPFFEGKKKLSTPPPHIKTSSLVTPSFEWVRGAGDSGTAGIGGAFYTGTRIPALAGKYVFGDFMKGEVYCLDLVGPEGRAVGKNWQLVSEVPDVSSVDTDSHGELYLCAYEAGMVFTVGPK